MLDLQFAIGTIQFAFDTRVSTRIRVAISVVILRIFVASVVYWKFAYLVAMYFNSSFLAPCRDNRADILGMNPMLIKLHYLQDTRIRTVFYFLPPALSHLLFSC
jgi:hypothetical protein